MPTPISRYKPWNGGANPAGDSSVSVMFADGTMESGPSRMFAWTHSGNNAAYDIVAYAILEYKK
jgi:hypothetical protein